MLRIGDHPHFHHAAFLAPHHIGHLAAHRAGEHDAFVVLVAEERGSGLHLIALFDDNAWHKAMEIGRFHRDDLRGIGLYKDLFCFAFQADVEASADPYGLGHLLWEGMPVG